MTRVVPEPMTDFSRRSTRLELLDGPDVDVTELERTLDELARINAMLGGYRPSIAGIRSLLPRGCRRFHVLDVGTGSGDVPRRITRWASRRGVDAKVSGIDLSSGTIALARKRSASDERLDFRALDLFELPPEERFDIVHTALTLHHFADAAAVSALERMFAASRWGLVVNDLHRHPLAYHSIRLLTEALSRSRLIRNDAPLSVLRAFRRAELEDLVTRAGIPPPRIRWRWAFRWQVVVRRTPEDAPGAAAGAHSGAGPR